MSSSSEDLLPLINRVQNLASSQPTTLASDDDDDVPQWLRNYTSPKPQQQPKKPKRAAALLSDSDDEPPPIIAPNTTAAPATATAGPSSVAPPATAQQGTPAAAALLAGPSGKGSQASNELVVHLPDKLPRTKLLVELEPDDHGATDLAGDAGAVGRVLVAGQPGQEDIRLDLKGVVYEAVVVALPGTVCVVNASGGGGDAKVEAMFSDMLQLRPDVNNALVRQQEVWVR